MILTISPHIFMYNKVVILNDNFLIYLKEYLYSITLLIKFRCTKNICFHEAAELLHKTVITM